mgnify:CR=1 FL=1
MDLEPGRVAGMVEAATENQTAIICHARPTEFGSPRKDAVCNGFFKLHETKTLDIAKSAKIIQFVDEAGEDCEP